MTASPSPNTNSGSSTNATVRKAGRSPNKAGGNTTADPDTRLPLDPKYLKGGSLDQGIDWSAPCGTPMYAVGPGKVVRVGMDGFGPHCVTISVNKGTFAGKALYYGHAQASYVKVGDTVTAGQHISDVGTMGISTGCHVEFGYADPSSGAPVSTSKFNTASAQGLLATMNTLIKGGVPAGTGSGGTASGSTAGSSGGGDPNAIARAAALSTFIQLPGIFDTFESQALKGKKSLLNDKPLLPFIEQLCQASLRNFQSMPNGNFYAFFPDYFGGLSGRTAYWEIDDIEVIDGQIDLSDDPLATHVYVVGDVALAFGTIDINDILFSSGVVTIFDAFASDFLTGASDATATQTAPKSPKSSKAKGTGSAASGPKQQQAFTQAGESAAKALSQKDNTLAFLQKYGARPLMEEAPMVRSPFFELFLAYQKFMLMWAQQFMTTFTFTFMPELFPGGIVSFPSHGIQCYVAEVTHNFDYEHGFTTQANLMAPAALPHSKRQNVHEGMVRAFTLGDDLPFDPFADSRKKRSQKK